jgi:hypothetical protein
MGSAGTYCPTATVRSDVSTGHLRRPRSGLASSDPLGERRRETRPLPARGRLPTSATLLARPETAKTVECLRKSTNEGLHGSSSRDVGPAYRASTSSQSIEMRIATGRALFGPRRHWQCRRAQYARRRRALQPLGYLFSLTISQVLSADRSADYVESGPCHLVCRAVRGWPPNPQADRPQARSISPVVPWCPSC